MEFFFATSKKLLKNRSCTFLVVSYFPCKLDFVSNILSMIVSGNSFLFLTRQDSFKRDLFDNFGNPKAFNTVLT